MTYTFWQAIAHTPWWVFAIFIYLVRVGFLARKPRIVAIKQLFIIPSLFVIASMIGLYLDSAFSYQLFFFWFAALLVGSILGWLQFSLLGIKAISNENKLYVPGTWSLLVIILGIFCVKYYFGYQTAVNPQLLLQPQFAHWLYSIYGLFTGLFVGRALYAKRCLKSGPFTTGTLATE